MFIGLNFFNVNKIKTKDRNKKTSRKEQAGCFFENLCDISLCRCRNLRNCKTARCHCRDELPQRSEGPRRMFLDGVDLRETNHRQMAATRRRRRAQNVGREQLEDLELGTSIYETRSVSVVILLSNEAWPSSRQSPGRKYWQLRRRYWRNHWKRWVLCR